MPHDPGSGTPVQAQDEDTVTIGWLALALLVLLGATIVASHLLTRVYSGTSSDRNHIVAARTTHMGTLPPRFPGERPIDTEQRVGNPPMPISIAPDWHVIRASQHDSIEVYGWADRRGGIARIPIQSAMQLLVERGWSGQTVTGVPK